MVRTAGLESKVIVTECTANKKKSHLRTIDEGGAGQGIMSGEAWQVSYTVKQDLSAYRWLVAFLCREKEQKRSQEDF